MSEHFPAPVSKFDEFLFETLCTESNGMQLSVISALARIDVDPWEEADRLSTMSRPTARTALISTLNRATGKDWGAGEEAAIAARLLELLPERYASAQSAPTKVAARDLLRRQFYWLAWLALALALSFFVPPRRTDECGASFARFSRNFPIKRRKRRHAPSKTGRPTGGVAR